MRVSVARRRLTFHLPTWFDTKLVKSCQNPPFLTACVAFSRSHRANGRWVGGEWWWCRLETRSTGPWTPHSLGNCSRFLPVAGKGNSCLMHQVGTVYERHPLFGLKLCSYYKYVSWFRIVLLHIYGKTKSDSFYCLGPQEASGFV